MKKRKETNWQKIKWKLFMMKINASLSWNYKVQRFLFRIHCKRNYHRFGVENDVYTTNEYRKNKRVRIVNYFKCYNCGTLYFPTEKDMRNYGFMDGRMNHFVKSMIKDQDKKNGKATTNSKE